MKERKVKPLSIFDLVTGGLELSNAVAQGKMLRSELPEHAIEVERAKQDLIYLLQLRQNFLAALPLGFISKTNDSMFAALNNALFNWKVNFDGLTSSQLDYYNLMLEKSLETRQALIRAGVQPKTDKLLARVIKNSMKKWPEQGDHRSAGEAGDDLVKGLKAKYEAFLAQPQAEQPDSE
jgi:hypothetical protein